MSANIRRIAMIDDLPTDAGIQMYVTLATLKIAFYDNIDGHLVMFIHPGLVDFRDPHRVGGMLVVPSYSVPTDTLAVTVVQTWTDYFAVQRARNHYQGLWPVEPEPGEDRDPYIVTVHIPNDDEKETFPLLQGCAKVHIYPGEEAGTWNGEIHFNG